jgi:hypothetical protein
MLHRRARPHSLSVSYPAFWLSSASSAITFTIVNALTRQRVCETKRITHWPVRASKYPPHNCYPTQISLALSPRVQSTTMANERPNQFGGVSRFGGPSRPGVARPPSSSTVGGSPSQGRAKQLGLGLGKGSGGLGKGKGGGKGLKRHM